MTDHPATPSSEGSPYRVTEWNGAVGDSWVLHQIRLDAMLAVFGDAAIAAAAPVAGERVLDIGCGAGATSIALADRVRGDAAGSGHVLGLDISTALIARAQAHAGDAGGGLDFMLADAADAALPEAGFDLLFSRFGVMFFADPVAAFGHMRRALRPGGRLAFVCWREAALNDWVRLPMGAIRDIVPPLPQPDPEAPGPFSFGDPVRVGRILGLAGFADVAFAALDRAIPFGQGATRAAAIDDAVRMAFEVGPLSRALADADETIRRRAATAVRAAFAERPGAGSVMIESAAWVVTARNPGG